ncbi:MAG TPA: hypothetical protein VFS77_23465, partial [Pyrinomonadaceae bacterium]|nr:hypothetical protein [Pyrinomonadaceae bacterium]
MKTLLLKDVNVVLPEGVAQDASVLIAEGRIAAVDAVGVPDATEEMSLKGATLFPGFIDVHIHGSAGVDVMDASADQLGTIAEFLASQGVTGWVPTFVPAADDVYASAVGVIAEAARRGTGARVLGVHYEGPFVNSLQCGALHTEYFKTYSGPADVEGLPLPDFADAVRMITLAPEIDGGVELVRELKTRGWVTSIG